MREFFGWKMQKLIKKYLGNKKKQVEAVIAVKNCNFRSKISQNKYIFCIFATKLKNSFLYNLH